MTDSEPRTAQGAASAEIDLLEIGRTLRAYRYWIAGATTAFALLAIIFALTATPRYRADATISEVSSAGAGGLSALAGGLGGIASLVGVNLAGFDNSSQLGMAVLRSRNLVEEFIRRNELQPILYPSQETETAPTLWRATEHFRKNILKINQDTRTGVIVVSVKWTDPVAAAEWANGLVALANELIRERARQTAERNITYLKKQIGQTPVIDMQRVMYSLVESETKTLMLANVREEFAFVVVDPAVTPEFRDSPKRTLMVIIGTLVGGFLGVMFAFAHSTVVRLRKRERVPA